jgi:phospholipase D1/2
VTPAARLLVPGRTCWVRAPVSASGLLIDGRDYFRAFYRAAETAQRYVLMAGWQFDSNVPLLRGPDRDGATAPVQLLPFLRELCRRRPALRIYLLCWDYSPAFYFQREWVQDLRFNGLRAGPIRFRFDDRHAIGASHHQKFVVVDGTLGFVGSMDLCNDRWDEREHRARCDWRCEPRKEDVAGPYHEAQACFTGPAAGELQALFVARWKSAGGGHLDLAAPVEHAGFPFRPSLRLAGGEVGLSRTSARTLMPEQPAVREIRHLYVDAIRSAERVVYLENQYFGSRAVYDAFIRRFRQKQRPRLNVVMVYPKALHSLSEELSMGPAQARMFRHLAAEAAASGHRVGIYYSTSLGPDGAEAPRYIHSKVLIVDDRFLSVGSANTNNRSMGLDTELNASWEVSSPRDTDLARTVRKVRVGLLAEHACLDRREDLRELYRDDGLVEAVDRFARRPGPGLRLHPMASELETNALFQALAPSDLDLDPERPVVEENLFEPIAPMRRRLVQAVLRRFRLRRGRRRRTATAVAVNPPETTAADPPALWSNAVHWIRRLAVPAVGTTVAATILYALWRTLRRLWASDPAP